MAIRPLIIALAWLAAPAARADELAVSVDGDTCTALDVEAEVEAALGRRLAPGEPALRARVAVRRHGGRIRVVVGMDRGGARTERTLELADCAAAGRALALVIALALDPSLGSFAEPPSVDAPEPAPASSADQAAPVDVAPTVELSFAVEVEPDPLDETPAELPAPEESPRLLVTMGAGALLDANALPGMNAGASAALGLRFDALVVELGGTYLAEARALATEPGASVALALGYGTLRAGVTAPPLGPVVLGTAVELDVGAMRGAATGARVQDQRAAWLPWVSVRGALFAELWLIPELSIRTSGSAGGAVSAPRFEIAGLGPLHSATAILVEGALSVVVRLA